MPCCYEHLTIKDIEVACVTCSRPSVTQARTEGKGNAWKQLLGGGATYLHGLNRRLRHQRAWVLSGFGLKKGVFVTHRLARQVGSWHWVF